ncbi:MAG: hypothetical protein ACK538_10560 [Armatimonadota bacterium]
MPGLVFESPDARIGLRANKTVAALNSRASERLGLATENVLGAPVERVFPSPTPSDWGAWQPQDQAASPPIQLSDSTFQLVPTTGSAPEPDQEPLFWFNLVPFAGDATAPSSPLVDLWTQALMAIETPAELFAIVRAGHRLMPGTAGLLAALDPATQTLTTVAKWGSTEVSPRSPPRREVRGRCGSVGRWIRWTSQTASPKGTSWRRSMKPRTVCRWSPADGSGACSPRGAPPTPG